MLETMLASWLETMLECWLENTLENWLETMLVTAPGSHVRAPRILLVGPLHLSLRPSTIVVAGLWAASLPTGKR
jgi:hypothetical protein